MAYNAEAQRRYRSKNVDKMRAKSTQYFVDNPEYRSKRRQDIRSYVRAAKLALGCSQCGYKAHHYALDWHHTDDDKEALVSKCDSIAAADREMAKCIVLCANCHRVHHYRENPNATLTLVPLAYNPILD